MYEDDYDENDDRETSTMKDLRKQRDEATKALKALQSEFESLKSDQRKASIKDVLASKGVNPKIAAFIPADVEGEDAVSQWLTEYADVFGVSVTEKEGALSPEEQTSMQRIQGTSAGTGANPDKAEQARAAIAAATTPEELNAVMRQFG